MIDFSILPLETLKANGFMRWGRLPVPNLWLMPGNLLNHALKGQVLHGIDGNEYRVGYNIDGTLLFGYLAYGIIVPGDSTQGGPELPPDKLVELSKGQRKRAQIKAAKDAGIFLL